MPRAPPVTMMTLPSKVGAMDDLPFTSRGYLHRDVASGFELAPESTCFPQPAPGLEHHAVGLFPELQQDVLEVERTALQPLQYLFGECLGAHAASVRG